MSMSYQLRREEGHKECARIEVECYLQAGLDTRHNILIASESCAEFPYRQKIRKSLEKVRLSCQEKLSLNGIAQTLT